jgi:DNA polymerase-3 subunit delta'
MLFKQVTGQQAAKKGLLQMTQSGRMAHATMFLGREGTGGLPLALAFAQYALCSNRGETDSCGECPNCRKVQRLEHADLHLSFPSIRAKSDKPARSANFIKEFRAFVKETPYGTTFDWLQGIGAENKQGNITAEECREIIDTLSLKSYEGGTKILLMWRPEYLGKEGNILLKLIEEPPADTLIIFVAEQEEDILATIRSRTQTVRLTPIPPSEIASSLVHANLADPRRAQQIGQIADGSYTEALRLLDHVENDLLPAVRNWFNAIFTNNGAGMVAFSEEWSKAGREGIRNLIGFTLSLLEASLRVAYLPEAAASLAPDEGQFATRLAGRRLSPQTLQSMIEALTEAGMFIERNAHSKSVLTALSLKMKDAVR